MDATAVLVAVVSSTALSSIILKLIDIFHDRKELKKQVEEVNRKTDDTNTKVEEQGKKIDALIQVLRAQVGERICWVGGTYLRRENKQLTKSEYDNLKALYDPYHEHLGGNGSAKKVMTDIESRMTILGEDD